MACVVAAAVSVSRGCGRAAVRNLSHMAAFVAVVDAGGFAAAAPRLGLTAQAVQKAVAGMEAELGLRLFTRFPRLGMIKLTEAGAPLVIETVRGAGFRAVPLTS